MFQKVLENKLIKQIGTLSAGSIIAQFIALLSTPILSRYYSPDAFGLLGSVLTIAAIVSSVVALKYEMAIVLTKTKRETNHLVAISLITLSVLFFTFSLVVFNSPSLLKSIGLNKPSTLIITLLVIIILGMGFQNILYQWYTKHENFIVMTKHKVIQKIVIVFLQILMVFILSNELGLIWGYSIGLIISLIYILIPLKSELLNLNIQKERLKLLAKKYYRFPLFTAPQNFLNSLSQGLPVLLLGHFFDMKIVGFYFFAVRILQLPSTIISGSIKQVFYKRASDLRVNIPELFGEFKKITLVLLCTITPPTIVIFIFGPEIFSFCFGIEWVKAGEMASWMILWVGLMFVNPPSNAILLVLNKNSTQLFFDVVLTLSRVVALLLGGMSGDIIYTIKLYSFVGVFFNLILIIFSYYYLRYGNSFWR